MRFVDEPAHVNRRGVLALGTAGALGAAGALLGRLPLTAAAAQPAGDAVSPREQFSLPEKLEIIDAHTHFYDPTRPEGVPWPGQGSPLRRVVLPEHLRALRHYRPVSGAIVVEASPWVEDNAWLLDLAKREPFIVGVVGNLAPDAPEFAARLKRFAANPLFRGIRVSAGIARGLLEADNLAPLRRLAEHDLALDVNGGPDTPALLARLAPRVPELRLVLNHIGNVRITAAAPPEAWRAGIAAAAEHANAYCKISALVEGAAPGGGKKAPTDLDHYRPYLDVVWKAFGARRVLFGSNWPVSESAADHADLQRLVLEYAAAHGAEAVRGFCSDNSRRAYKWIDRTESHDGPSGG